MPHAFIIRRADHTPAIACGKYVLSSRQALRAGLTPANTSSISQVREAQTTTARTYSGQTSDPQQPREVTPRHAYCLTPITFSRESSSLDWITEFTTSRFPGRRSDDSQKMRDSSSTASANRIANGLSYSPTTEASSKLSHAWKIGVCEGPSV